MSAVPVNSPQAAQARWAQIHAAGSAPMSPPSEGFSPPAMLLDKADMATFSATTFTRTDDQRVVKCAGCGKPLLESALEEHVQSGNCQITRERAAQASAPSMKRRLSEVSDSSTNVSPTKKAKTSLVVTLGDASGKKKLKVDKSSAAVTSNGSGSSGKKDKDKDKSGKSTKSQRGPVDVERHCGVINDKGYPCSRSLTCKTHPMGAKRSVPGRSQPFDALLHEWQKATKPEVFSNRKPVQPRVGPGSEMYGANSEHGGKKGRRKTGGGDGGSPGREGSSKRERRDKAAAKAAALMVGEYAGDDSDAGEYDEAAALVDSDEEVDAVARGLSRVPRGRPLGLVGLVPGVQSGMGFSGASMWLQRNEKLARMRDSLRGVFVTPAATV